MIYLDYASMYPTVEPLNSAHFYLNPNANYATEERQSLMNLEKFMMENLNLKTGRLIYFRTATECVEWIVRKLAEIGFDCVASDYEHSSVIEACEATGGILDDVAVLCMLVNNLNGQVFDTKAYLESIKATALPDSTYILGTDLTAAVGHVKIPEDFSDYTSFAWFDGVKIGAHGIAALWIREDLMKILGASDDIRNQWGLRTGTVSVAMVESLYDSVHYYYHNNMWSFDNHLNHYKFLAQYLEDLVRGIGVVHHYENETDAIRLVTLNGCVGEALQSYLAQQKIYVGLATSSCSDTENRFETAIALGLTEDEALHSIRVSFGDTTTSDDIRRLVKGINDFKEMFGIE